MSLRLFGITAVLCLLSACGKNNNTELQCRIGQQEDGLKAAQTKLETGLGFKFTSRWVPAPAYSESRGATEYTLTWLPVTAAEKVGINPVDQLNALGAFIAAVDAADKCDSSHFPDEARNKAGEWRTMGGLAKQSQDKISGEIADTALAIYWTRLEATALKKDANLSKLAGEGILDVAFLDANNRPGMATKRMTAVKDLDGAIKYRHDSVTRQIFEKEPGLLRALLDLPKGAELTADSIRAYNRSRLNAAMEKVIQELENNGVKLNPKPTGAEPNKTHFVDTNNAKFRNNPHHSVSETSIRDQWNKAVTFSKALKANGETVRQPISDDPKVIDELFK